MVLVQVVTERLAIGVGCRKHTVATDIITLVRQSCSGLSLERAALFTLDIKEGEPGLHAAAHELGLGLTFLSAEQLKAVPAEGLIHSHKAARAVGVSSVAESAALVGAGPGSRLIVPRQVGQGVTCAVAVGGSGMPA